MKKFTSILALFLVVLGISAQVNVNSLDKINANKSYTLTATRSALCASGDSTVSTIGKLGIEANAADPNQQFAFVKPEGGNEYYLYSVSAKKFVQKGNTLNATSGDPVTFIDASSKRPDAVMLSMGDGFYFNINSAKNLVIDGWNSIDDGNDFVVAEAADFNPAEALAAIVTKKYVDVTYTYILDGVEVGTPQVVKQEVGSAFAAPALHNWLSFSYPEGSVTETTTNVVVTCTENLPFVKSASFNDAKWYSMTIAENKYYLSYVEGATSIVLDRTETVGEDKDAWCFVGNVVDGFKVYNKAAGDKMILSSPTDMSAGDGQTFPILVEEAAVPEGNNVTWDFTNGNKLGEAQGYFMAQHGFASNRVNKRGANLAYWTGGADNGSTILFNEVVVLDDAALIAKFVEANLPVAGYVGGYSLEQLKAVEGFTTVAQLEEFKKTAETIQLADGQLYRIKNYCRDLSISNAAVANNGGYMGDNQLTGDSVSCHGQSLADASFVWTLVKESANVYRIMNMNSGKYIGKTAAKGSQYLAQVADAADAGLYEVVALGNAQFNIVCTNGEGEHNQLHASSPRTAGPGVMNWNAGENSASAWHFVPATSLEVNLNEADSTAAEKWASLYLPFDVQLPTGLEAYIGAVNDEVTAFNLTQVKDVPAYTGVILRGNAPSYVLNLGAATSDVELNMLQGSTVQGSLVYVDPDYPEDGEIALNSQFLVLGNGELGVGMYNPAGTILKANKAFFRNMASPFVSALKFVFGEVTGVEGVEVETEKAGAVYYDLSGRRVAHPVKGIYVKNGKKVYVK